MHLTTVSSTSTSPAEFRTDRGNRLPSIDIFRGLIMVWMALDHTRDFFTNIRFEPENINLTWPGLFFTALDYAFLCAHVLPPCRHRRIPVSQSDGISREGFAVSLHARNLAGHSRMDHH